MKWDMEIEQIEVILHKIWDLHDKLSEAIHSISRHHFLAATKNHPKSDDNARSKQLPVAVDDSSVHEARSLNSIRTALEILEDHLQFFHTAKVQQQVERDAAIARLEQSRIVLAMRLAEHHGKNYNVISEALAFVGDVSYAANYASHGSQYGPSYCPNGQKLMPNGTKRSNTLIKMLFSTLNCVRKSLKMDHVSGILGNAAMVAVSMLAFLHLHQVAFKEPSMATDDIRFDRILRRNSRLDGSSPDEDFSNFDVLSARG